MSAPEAKQQQQNWHFSQFLPPLPPITFYWVTTSHCGSRKQGGRNGEPSSQWSRHTRAHDYMCRCGVNMCLFSTYGLYMCSAHVRTGLGKGLKTHAFHSVPGSFPANLLQNAAGVHEGMLRKLINLLNGQSVAGGAGGDLWKFVLFISEHDSHQYTHPPACPLRPCSCRTSLGFMGF